MNSELRYSATPMTMGSFAFLASLALPSSGQAADWPKLENPPFITERANGTFGPTTAGIAHGVIDSGDFGAQMAAVYAMLSEGQEPLGDAFEAVWDANVDGLYEA